MAFAEPSEKVPEGFLPRMEDVKEMTVFLDQGKVSYIMAASVTWTWSLLSGDYMLIRGMCSSSKLNVLGWVS